MSETLETIRERCGTYLARNGGGALLVGYGMGYLEVLSAFAKASSARLVYVADLIASRDQVAKRFHRATPNTAQHRVVVRPKQLVDLEQWVVGDPTAVVIGPCVNDNAAEVILSFARDREWTCLLVRGGFPCTGYQTLRPGQVKELGVSGIRSGWRSVAEPWRLEVKLPVVTKWTWHFEAIDGTPAARVSQADWWFDTPEEARAWLTRSPREGTEGRRVQLVGYVLGPVYQVGVSVDLEEVKGHD